MKNQTKENLINILEASINTIHKDKNISYQYGVLFVMNKEENKIEIVTSNTKVLSVLNFFPTENEKLEELFLLNRIFISNAFIKLLIDSIKINQDCILTLIDFLNKYKSKDNFPNYKDVNPTNFTPTDKICYDISVLESVIKLCKKISEPTILINIDVKNANKIVLNDNKGYIVFMPHIK